MNRAHNGYVYLIGAGPGDPGLITVKGRDCIAKSQVILYDYLANERLLEHAPPAPNSSTPARSGGCTTGSSSRSTTSLLKRRRRDGSLPD